MQSKVESSKDSVESQVFFESQIYFNPQNSINSITLSKSIINFNSVSAAAQALLLLA
jgi:hypothetical protein